MELNWTSNNHRVSARRCAV